MDVRRENNVRQLTDKELRVLIRDAVISRWASGDDDSWIEVRVDNGWSEQEANDFLGYYDNQIKRTETQMERWLEGEGEFV